MIGYTRWLVDIYCHVIICVQYDTVGTVKGTPSLYFLSEVLIIGTGLHNLHQASEE